MFEQWYFQVMGDITGPITQNDLIAAVAAGTIDRETLIRKGEDGNWRLAGEVGGLFEKAEEKRRKDQAEAAALELAARAAEEREKRRWQNMTISTGGLPPPHPYKTIDIVFAIDADGHAGILFGKSGDPNMAFARVKEQ